MTDSSDDLAPMLNAHRDGWCTAMDLRFVRATADEVVAEWTVAPQHLQAYGIVHGGVHSGVIETLASVGAALHGMPRGQSVVGLENHTSFLRAVREGTLRATARRFLPKYERMLCSSAPSLSSAIVDSFVFSSSTPPICQVWP